MSHRPLFSNRTFFPRRWPLSSIPFSQDRSIASCVTLYDDEGDEEKSVDGTREASPPPLTAQPQRQRKRESYFVPFGDFYFTRAEAITAYTQKEGGGEAWQRQEEVELPPPPVEPLYYTPDRVELMAGEMVVGEEGEEEAGAIVIADLMKPFDRPIELRNTTPERP